MVGEFKFLPNTCITYVVHAYLSILCFYIIDLMCLSYLYINILLNSTNKTVKVIYTLFYNFVYHVTRTQFPLNFYIFEIKSLQINANTSI